MAIKYNDLYMDLRRRLREAGAEDATQAARELVCTASGKTKNELLRDGLLYASPEVERSAYSLCARHLAGEPVAYLIGEWEFYGLGLDISPAVLIPRPETEVLVDVVLEGLADVEAPCVLEVGCGTGCIACSLAREAGTQVVATDVSSEAVACARANVEMLGLEELVEIVECDCVEGVEGAFDCLVSNPPYIPTAELAELPHEVTGFEPSLALDGGADGLVFFDRLVAEALPLVKDGGLFACELHETCLDEAARRLREAGCIDVKVTKDLVGRDRIVSGICRDLQ